MGSFIKGLGDVSEPLLACSVPDVESDGLALIVNPFDFKIDPNGGEILSLESIIAVANQQTGFANPTIPNHQVFQSGTF